MPIENLCVRLRTGYAGRLSVTHEAADYIEELEAALEVQVTICVASTYTEDGVSKCPHCIRERVLGRFHTNHAVET